MGRCAINYCACRDLHDFSVLSREVLRPRSRGSTARLLYTRMLGWRSLAHLSLFFTLLALFCARAAVQAVSVKAPRRTAARTLLTPGTVRTIKASTASTPLKAPPKTDAPRTTPKTRPTTKPNEGFVIKETRSIADEIEEYFRSDLWAVVLYNDPFNKRQYVAEVLMSTFSWTPERATEVMMTAHLSGAAVAVEVAKAAAFEYVEKLRVKGLLADAIQVGADKDGTSKS